MPKVLDDETLILDGFVIAHEIVGHHAREVVVLKNYTPVVNEFVWRCLQHLQRGRRLLVVLDGKRNHSKYATNEARKRRRVKALMQVELQLDEDAEGYEIDASTLKLAAAVSGTRTTPSRGARAVTRTVAAFTYQRVFRSFRTWLVSSSTRPSPLRGNARGTALAKTMTTVTLKK